MDTITLNLNLGPVPDRDPHMNEFASVVISALAELTHGQSETLEAIASLRRKMMALSTTERAALDGLSAQLDDLSSDIDRALDAANATTVALRSQVAALEVLRDQLMENDTADAATIASLTAMMATLNDAAAAHEADVVSGLSALSGKITATDSHVEALGGGPTPPPVEEPPVEPPVEEPPVEEPPVEPPVEEPPVDPPTFTRRRS